MKIAVVGSRNYLATDFVKYVVGGFPTDTVVVTGGARGVDSAAEEAAREFLIPEPIIFRAKWRTKNGKYNPGAGFARNRLIVEECDSLIAFWDMESKGTRNSIDLAMGAKKPVGVFDPSTKLAMLADWDELDLPEPPPDIWTPTGSDFVG